MLKYCVGIDVSMNDCHCCLSVIDNMQKVTVKASKRFTNKKAGFDELHAWIKKQRKEQELPLVVVMEATGIYYEQLAYYLHQAKYTVSVVLPNKAKKYMQAIGQKSKNDSIDATGLARMGCEQSLEKWNPADGYFYDLREMTRQYQSTQELKTSIGNQLHAAQLGSRVVKMVVKQLQAQLKLMDRQLEALRKAITAHINGNTEVKQQVENICQVKGMGLLTVAVILAETNGFILFKNAGQLVSYAGYDVVENQSGSHRGKTRISKKGNSHIRRAMHMPALSAVRFKEQQFENLYNRTLEKHKIKMKSYVAVQKKLLTTVYFLWKNKTAYDPLYTVKMTTREQETEPSSLVGASAPLLATT